MGVTGSLGSGIEVSARVRRAVAEGEPVVALESTIFTHGLPADRNLDTARDAEQRIRAAGAVPATIGVVGGVPTVGLSAEQIVALGTGSAVTKASVRDLPVVAAKGLDAGTTVAATALLAHRSGISVFATGGLGGVHHGAETTFDESADLPALATIPIVLVSAGVKSILNIPATLERLETLSIPVVGFRTRNFPAFFVADSGYSVEYAVDNGSEIADMVAAREALGLSAALLVANPVPTAQQMDPLLHRSLLARAWESAESEGVSGNRLTPYLLDFIQRATDGHSVDVNVAVYRNNIAVATEIALAIADR